MSQTETKKRYVIGDVTKIPCTVKITRELVDALRRQKTVGDINEKIADRAEDLLLQGITTAPGFIRLNQLFEERWETVEANSIGSRVIFLCDEGDVLDIECRALLPDGDFMMLPTTDLELGEFL